MWYYKLADRSIQWDVYEANWGEEATNKLCRVQHICIICKSSTMCARLLDKFGGKTEHLFGGHIVVATLQVT